MRGREENSIRVSSAVLLDGTTTKSGEKAKRRKKQLKLKLLLKSNQIKFRARCGAEENKVKKKQTRAKHSTQVESANK